MRICIDAGHNYSGFDTGAVGNGLKEQDITFEIADRLKRLLVEKGIEITMTRAKLADNVGVNAKDSINERARIANTTRCDYFVSIHCNAGGGTGTETLIVGTGGQAEKLAKCINDSIVKKMKLKNRGVKVRPELGVLRLTDMPAVLVETAFIDNKSDAVLLKNNTFDFADAIAGGVFEFLNMEVNEMITEPEEIVEALSKTIEITEPQKAVSQLEKAKNENSSLYWMLYKIANLK